MVIYTIWLDEPTDTFHAAVKNLGEAVRDKDGLFTVRLLDKERKPLYQSECSLPVSKKLGESYVYVSATPGGGLIKMGPVSASRHFQGIQVRYEPAFTDRPLSSSQLGSLFYTVTPGANLDSEEYTITKIAQPDATREMSK